MFNIHKDPWEAALASDEFYFKCRYGRIFKMKRLNTATFLCTEAVDDPHQCASVEHPRNQRVQ